MRPERLAYYDTPREDILRLVPRDSRRVLSVGCGAAATEEALQSPGREIVGIELNQEMARLAGPRISEVLVGDAESLELGYPSGYFDCLLYADVLEHFRSPRRVIERHLACLAPDGALVASVPNSRFWHAVYTLCVLGDWPYSDRGIFDETHLRVFTPGSFARLLKDLGLAIEATARNYRLMEDTTRHRHLAEKLAIGPLKDFFTFQYLVRARKTVTK